MVRRWRMRWRKCFFVVVVFAVVSLLSWKRRAMPWQRETLDSWRDFTVAKMDSRFLPRIPLNIRKIFLNLLRSMIIAAISSYWANVWISREVNIDEIPMVSGAKPQINKWHEMNCNSDRFDFEFMQNVWISFRFIVHRRRLCVLVHVYSHVSL